MSRSSKATGDGESAPSDGHGFVVLAYKESPYLSGCLQSLRDQSEPSPVLLSTSTPSAYIDRVAREYGAEVVVSERGAGIAADWNAALANARTRWVTLAHQDDVYLPGYGARIKEAIGRHPHALLAFTDYEELGGEGPRERSLNLRAKRMLLEVGFLGAESIGSRFRKRALLAFGSPIPCPSVAYNRSAVGDFHFAPEYRVNLDWMAWLTLSEAEGEFVRVREVLMQHRIHEGSETSANIQDGTRRKEDYRCFSAIWPASVASLLTAAYAWSYRSNRVSPRKRRSGSASP